jgi:hypothetical protein
MLQRIHARLDDFGIALEIVDAVEKGMGVAAFAPAGVAIVLQRVDAAGGDVGVAI